MTERETQPPASQGITIMCGECGDIIEVKDPAGLIRALHLLNACSVRALLGKEEG